MRRINIKKFLIVAGIVVFSIIFHEFLHILTLTSIGYKFIGFTLCPSKGMVCSSFEFIPSDVVQSNEIIVSIIHILFVILILIILDKTESFRKWLSE